MVPAYRRGQYPWPVPFTVSHVAAVLPATRFTALRDPLIISALAIGAMSPDVPYFLPLGVWWAWGHNWVGLVVQDVPVTLALVVAYWALLAAPLRELSPGSIRQRLPVDVLVSHGRAPWRALVLVVLAAAFGAATHIIWDAFTHSDRFGVHAVGWLQIPALVGPLPAYRVLQYASSAIGLALICWSLVRWFRTTPPVARSATGLGWRWQMTFAALTIVAAFIAWWSVRGMFGQVTDVYGLRALLYTGLVRSVELVALVVLTLALVTRFAMARPAESHPE